MFSSFHQFCENCYPNHSQSFIKQVSEPLFVVFVCKKCPFSLHERHVFHKVYSRSIFQHSGLESVGDVFSRWLVLIATKHNHILFYDIESKSVALFTKVLITNSLPGNKKFKIKTQEISLAFMSIISQKTTSDFP